MGTLIREAIRPKALTTISCREILLLMRFLSENFENYIFYSYPIQNMGIKDRLLNKNYFQ